MTTFWDEQAFRECVEAVGYDLQLCVRKIVQPANPAYGLKEQSKFVCKPVLGTVENKQSTIFTNSGPLVAGTLVAHLLPNPEFDFGNLPADAYLSYMGVAYQMKLIKPIFSEGQIWSYTFELQNTQKTTSLDRRQLGQIPNP